MGEIMNLQMIANWLFYVFGVLCFIACGVVMIVRFRGSLGAVFGPIAIILWLGLGVVQFAVPQLLLVFGSYEKMTGYWTALSKLSALTAIGYLLAQGCLLAAVLTLRVYRRPQQTTPMQPYAVQNQTQR